jgi:hypothetical protein
MRPLRHILSRGLVSAVFTAAALASFDAAALPVTFNKLAGVTGGTLAATAVYKADLSVLGLGSVLSIGIQDASAGLGGAPGQFSGFDLDAIKLSHADCASAACAAGATGISVFDFVAGTVIVPGVQRAPADARLFGTDASGSALDNAVATLDLFDAESTTTLPGADGFISLGDGGRIDFNLTAALNTAGLFLYIGEVGDNGEVAAGTIDVRDSHVPVPGTWSLAALGLVALCAGSRRRS